MPEGDAAAGAAGLAEALNNHERVRKSTDLPLFYGRKEKDVVTAHHLMDRIETASTIAGWNEERQCKEFYMILRDRALTWWNSLDNEEVDNIRVIWRELKKAFLNAYAPRYTARATCNIFVELQQRSGESVQDYYLRVTESFRRLCEAKPEDMTTDIEADLVPRADVPGTGLTVAQALVYKKEGIRQDEKYFLHQLFVAGLREDLRTKVMEAGRRNLKDSVNSARELEVILQDRKIKGHHVAHIEHREEEEHIDVMYRKPIPRGSNHNRGGFGRGRGQTGRPGTYATQFKGTCRYCKKYGHSQQRCIARKEKGAPLVDQYGKPYSKGVQCIEDTEDNPIDMASLRIAPLNF